MLPEITQLNSDSLSDKGKIQADNLAERLKSFSINMILSSSLTRAMETIKTYLEKNSFTSEIWDVSFPHFIL